jgi:phage tail-like protein
MANPPDNQLLNQLPTPFRVDTLEFEDPHGATSTVHPTADFLKAFEAILLTGEAGSADRQPLLGVEQLIDKLATYFIAGRSDRPDEPQTPEEFLPWLAGWLAFAMRADLPTTARRDFIHNLSTLYRWRGTQENLKRVLTYFTGLPSTDSTVTVLKDEPLCFEVMVDLSALMARHLADVPRLIEIARALIQREKPAHTRYVLASLFPSFQIGITAVVHGYVDDPQNPGKQKPVGTTLLGVNVWEK